MATKKSEEELLFWLVTEDRWPTPFELDHRDPFQIVYGDKAFVKSFCDALNDEAGGELYEYSEIMKQDICYQNMQK